MAFDITLASFFIFAIAFVLFMNIQRHYKAKLIILFRIKYPELYSRYILSDTGHYPLFIARPIRLMRYIWFEKSYPKDISILIKKILLYQKLGILCLILVVIIPLLIELIFQYIII